MAHETWLELRLAGQQSVRPGLIRSKEVAELIDAFEDVIASVVVAKHPDIPKDRVVVGLREVLDQSVGLRFQPNIQELTIPAAREVANAISDQEITSLPLGAIDGIRKISRFVKRYKCNAEIYTQNGRRDLLSTITPETEIPEISPFQGETTLYGEITRVGGKKPKIQFQDISGKIIYCGIYDGENRSFDEIKAIAKKAGNLLYSKTALYGLAEWNSKSFELVRFDVIDILDYQEVSLSDSIGELAQAVGGVFDEIEDIDKHFSEIRYGTGA